MSSASSRQTDSRDAIGRGVSLALVAFGVLFFLLPLVGLVARAPWSDAWSTLTDESALRALRLSLLVSLGALVLSLLFGLPLAWVLARKDFVGRRFLHALIIVPMVLPPVVAGVGLITALGRRGIAGDLLDALGLQLPFSTGGAIVAATFVAAPFLIVTMVAAFRSVDRRPEDAAATLGAGRLLTFRSVILPAVGPALGAGAALCWARALGEFGATITFAGNLAGRTQTAPLAVYQDLQTADVEGAIMLSLVLLAISIAILAAFHDRLFAR